MNQTPKFFWTSFNPFNFAYNKTSRQIYAACSFLFSNAELYWIAGALNLETYLGNYSYRDMCIFHVVDYTREKREECKQNMRAREYSFPMNQLVSYWVNYWKTSELPGNYDGNRILYVPIFEYYDQLSDKDKQPEVEINLVNLLLLFEDGTISENDFEQTLKDITHRNSQISKEPTRTILEFIMAITTRLKGITWATRLFDILPTSLQSTLISIRSLYWDVLGGPPEP